MGDIDRLYFTERGLAYSPNTDVQIMRCGPLISTQRDVSIVHKLWSFFAFRNPQSIPPVPQRDSSLSGHVTKDEELLYMAGRKPYNANPLGGGPPHGGGGGSGAPQLAGSTSTSSLVSDPGGVGLGAGLGDTMDRIFESSLSLANSEDSTSIQSATSDHGGGGAQTPEAVRRSLLRPSSAPGQGKSNSASRPESPNPPGYVLGLGSLLNSDLPPYLAGSLLQ